MLTAIEIGVMIFGFVGFCFLPRGKSKEEE